MLRRQKIKEPRKLSKSSLELIESRALVDNQLLRDILLAAFELATLATSMISNPVIKIILKILIGGSKFVILESKARKLEAMIEVEK